MVLLLRALQPPLRALQQSQRKHPPPLRQLLSRLYRNSNHRLLRFSERDESYLLRYNRLLRDCSDATDCPDTTDSSASTTFSSLRACHSSASRSAASRSAASLGLTLPAASRAAASSASRLHVPHAPAHAPHDAAQRLLTGRAVKLIRRSPRFGRSSAKQGSSLLSVPGRGSATYRKSRRRPPSTRYAPQSQRLSTNLRKTTNAQRTVQSSPATGRRTTS